MFANTQQSSGDLASSGGFTARLLTESAAASYLAVSRRTLEVWRSKGTGPAFIRLNGTNGGRAVRYRAEDLSAWLAAGVVEGDRV